MPKIKASKWNGQPATYAHLKLDGHFLEYRDSRFYTSHPTDITEQMPKYIRNLLGHVRLDKGQAILGELHVSNQRASYVKTALAARSDALRISFFATTALPAEASLYELESWFIDRSLLMIPFRTLEDNWTPEVLMNTMPSYAEGWMLKDGNLLNWRKLKREPTIDLVVTGVTEGNGKHLGLIGALKCSVYMDPRDLWLASMGTKQVTYRFDKLKEVCRAGGMTDDERIEMTIHSPIGRVVEVAYQHVDSQGRLRHPRFVRFRDDKEPEDCTADQDEELLR